MVECLLNMCEALASVPNTAGWIDGWVGGVDGWMVGGMGGWMFGGDGCVGGMDRWWMD